MGLFGKKKTPEEILAEGRALYEQGNYGKASLVLLKASGKLGGEVDYWLGRSYLAIDAKKGQSPGKTAKQFLKFAAEAGHEEAARLLSGQADAAEPGAADADVTADEAMDRGLEAYDRKDYVEAMSWFRKAELLGSARAALMIGVLFSNGLGFPKDAAKGLEYFLKAAEQGVSNAQLYAAAKYESGADGVPQDLEKAVYWYEKSAEQGEAVAQHNLALLYANGRGTAQDYEKARYWLQKSAAQDEEVSEYSRGALAQLEEIMSKSDPEPAPKAKTDEELYTEGARAYVEKNYADAVQIWRQLAEKGMARAQDGLALLYYRGDGVEKDEKKSAEWYRKAAEQGHGSACFNLAIFYERGIGVTKDLSEALRWAEKAKAVGAEKADNLIAEIRHNIEAEENRKNLTKPSAPKPGDELSQEEKYRKGMELFRAGDYDGAYSLLCRVCRVFGANVDAYPDGQAAMGWMCEHGRGVEVKDSKAHLHYKIAARNGNKDGMTGFVRLTAKVTSPSLKDCEAALDYARQLGTSEAKAAVPALEQKLAEAQLREKYAELDLSEDNVEAIFNRCGKVNDDGSTAWNEEALKQNKANIFYLLGQLALVHKDMAEPELNETFFARYDGKNWTNSLNFVIDLLNMGGSSGFCSFFKKDGEQFVKLNLYTLKQTFSPKDPDFPVWWDSAEGLTVRAEIAKTAGNLTDVLSLYEKAAEMGDAGAQYQVGTMYESGRGAERDLSRAIEWYQKASNQGHEAAKASLEKCQTVVKAMQGDPEAQYAYAERLGWSDKAKAFSFYLKAAKQGHRDAQYKTGYCYALGKGTKKDSQEAIKWLQAATKQGHKNAGILSGLMRKKGLFGDKATDLEVELSKLIDRYETISDSEKDLLIDIYEDLSDDMKDKFNHAQAKSLRKLADRM